MSLLQKLTKEPKLVIQKSVVEQVAELKRERDEYEHMVNEYRYIIDKISEIFMHEHAGNYVDQCLDELYDHYGWQ